MMDMEPQRLAVALTLTASALILVGAFAHLHAILRTTAATLREKYRMSMALTLWLIGGLLGVYGIAVLLYDLPTWLQSGTTLLIMPLLAVPFAYRRQLDTGE